MKSIIFQKKFFECNMWFEEFQTLGGEIESNVSKSIVNSFFCLSD